METEHHTTYNIRTNIELNDTERDIFDIFSSFVREKNLGTTIRVAGGWVRDKVLGRESSDIDFAVDNMTGEQFVTQAYAHLKEKMDVKGFGVTKLNPEQSKHLETAKIEVKGVWIDVVNLRGETYAQDSRIPTIDIGTPEQDAYRRDLTINSLFYNVNTGKIEDFTGKGLSDLEKGIANTPLPPDQTFIDDPLRILRMIRFIGRFDLKMHDSVSESLKKPEIISGLQKKVSKERIGIELKLMLCHPGVFKSVQLFHHYGLFPYMIEIPATCFELAEKPELIKSLFERSYLLCEIADKFLVQKDEALFMETFKNFFPLSDIRFYVYLAMIMEPFAQYKVEINPKSKKTEPLVLNLVKSAVKFTNNDAEIVSLATQVKEKFQKLAKDLLDGKNILLYTAKTIKDMAQLAKTWELGFVLAVAADISQHEGEPQQVIAVYQKLYQYIHENGLNKLFEMKPMLDGGQIQQIFQAKGPTIQVIKDNVFYWQIEHPTKTLEDLQAYIASNKDEFLKNHFE